ncbi:MAG: hypothetical protein WCS75_11995 [Sphingomonas sp.]|uniref:hypothetical protein n=1 Tax=Sphingomonas sp. TaxID=28214 RepID=UPI003567CE13
MRVFAYVLLAAAMLLGYIGPIMFGVAVAPVMGQMSVAFPQMGAWWPIVFGVLAAIAAVTPILCAERNGWLRL